MAGVALKSMENNGAKTINTVSGINPVEAEAIQLFIQFSRVLGQRRSVAEVYGLLFMSPLPLDLNEVESRLQMSRGSAFQGLQFLQELGAVRAVKIPNRRRMHFEAVAELRQLAGNFLRQQISTNLSDSGNRLERIAESAQLLTGEARTHAIARAKLLKSWKANTHLILPILLRLLGARNGK